ncbi:hypothetical protein JLK41_09035 [Ectopseudomonas khazarica]|uniref:hypothetical protein n=1 Tax=Ectopseudomonas khazarica TaxID=2502979 RepID=UPI001AEFC5FD|nr:hypothetical protein [Pseudomonas khazarica]QTS88286.1 hypothetical protein JLK41_09035 [Pseudomonas khazarica]
MKAANPVVRLHLVRERAHGGLRIRQWDTLDDIGPGVHELYAGPAELEGVSEVLAEGHGFWRSCSGCHETEDGHPVGSYAYSSVLQCSLGSGCSECGGLGATWDNTDYGRIAHEEGLNDEFDEGAARCSACACGRTDPHAQTLACIKAAGDALRSSGSIRSMLESLDAPGAVFGGPAAAGDGEVAND